MTTAILGIYGGNGKENGNYSDYRVILYFIYGATARSKPFSCPHSDDHNYHQSGLPRTRHPSLCIVCTRICCRIIIWGYLNNTIAIVVTVTVTITRILSWSTKDGRDCFSANAACCRLRGQSVANNTIPKV